VILAIEEPGSLLERVARHIVLIAPLEAGSDFLCQVLVIRLKVAAELLEQIRASPEELCRPGYFLGAAGQRALVDQSLSTRCCGAILATDGSGYWSKKNIHKGRISSPYYMKE